MRFKLIASFVFILGLIVAPMAQADQISGNMGEAGQPVRIVGFGDSLMAGYQLSPGDAFPVRLEQALKKAGYDVVIENAGVSGDTTAGGLARLDWSVPDGTRIVILELGANDALRGVSPEITEKNLDAMLARLKQRGIAVILAGMIAPPNMGKDYGDRFNAIYPRLAQKYDVPLYSFFLDGVAAQKNLLLEDGMHPNPNGVARMVEGFLPTVEAALRELGKERT
ncbi:arylesterase [Phyllobacterium phragmitis]|uniref:Arylesterase n=1 Tax=Phyllobacterium phragmitis TaxID=2670329 RepID=A0A2S9ISC4_9HYPH|nr:arylesterase [Phyllobacterium phragmitis]